MHWMHQDANEQRLTPSPMHRMHQDAQEQRLAPSPMQSDASGCARAAPGSFCDASDAISVRMNGASLNL
jgi:hypothetical protein